MAVDQETKRNRRGSYRKLLTDRIPWRLVGAIALVVVGATTYSRVVTHTDDTTEDRGGTAAGRGANDDVIDDVGPTDGARVTTTFADPAGPVVPTCPAFDGSSPRRVNFSSVPPMCIDPTLDWQARVWTTRGYFDIALDAEAAPTSVNNFVFLALWHYYDGVGFHWVVPDFVIQAGDAVGHGPDCDAAFCGGPGYQFAGELPAGDPPHYPLGSVALANSGPGTDGSQFFIVVGEQGEQLSPNYSRLGSVVAGMPVVEAIAETGDTVDAVGTPNELTVVEQISISARSIVEPGDDGGLLNPGD